MNEFLRNVLGFINTIVGNYGWSIVLFTLVIRLVLLPFDVKSKKGMRKTQAIQPKLAALQKKYQNDKEKLNKKTMELYKKENVSMFSGCLPMLLTMPILFAMFAGMRMISNEQIAHQVFHMLGTGQAPEFQSWLWIKNLWMPDSPFHSIMQSPSSVQMIPADIWQKVYNLLSPQLLEGLTATGLSFDFSGAASSQTVQAMVSAMQALPVYQAEMVTVPGFQNFFMSLSLYKNFNGLFILPILSAVSQLAMTQFTTPQQPAAPSADGKPAPGTSGFMKWFFPLFSLYICATSNAGFSIYWVTSNVIAIAQNFFLNRYFDAKDKKDLIQQKEGVVK